MKQALSVGAEYIALVGDLMTIGIGASTDFRAQRHCADLGRSRLLAAIAAIRTFLSDFLEKDIEDARSAPGRERIEA